MRSTKPDSRCNLLSAAPFREQKDAKLNRLALATLVLSRIQLECWGCLKQPCHTNESKELVQLKRRAPLEDEQVPNVPSVESL